VVERSKIGRGMVLTTYVHLVPMLSAAIPLYHIYTTMACKGEVHPVTDHEGPEGEKRHSTNLSYWL